MNIGKNITRLREARSLSIRDLSFKTNIAENSLSAIEHGKKGVGLITLIKLADALNCSLDYLVGRDGSQHSPKVEQPDQDDQNADKAKFLAIMSDLYDKYFKLPTPSAISNAETIDADASVDIHSVKSDVVDGTDTNDADGSMDKNAVKSDVVDGADETIAADGCTEKQIAVKTLNNIIKAGIPWKESLWTCVRL